MSASVLVIMMEPAPYRTGLIRELRSLWTGALDVIYVGRNLTQAWAAADIGDGHFLPKGKIAALREIARRIGSSRVDLVQVAGWGHPVLLGSILTAAAKGIPIVSETDTPAPLSEPGWRRWAKRALYPQLLGLPRLFLPAGSQQATYLQRFGVKDRNIRHGKLTVDVDAIKSFASHFDSQRRHDFRQRHGISDSVKTLFLYLGRLESFKGIQDLFDAFLRLRTDRNDVALMIAGSGSLRRFVEDASVALRSVHYLGHLTAECVWEAYCSADVFILPSRREPWGLVINEAMAAGLPVIASTAVGCIDDILRANRTGLTFRAGDTSSLLAAMRALAEDAETRRQMGREGRELISDWTLAEEARIMVAAWNEVLERSSSIRNAPRGVSRNERNNSNAAV